jgi:hypothetical protein
VLLSGVSRMTRRGGRSATREVYLLPPSALPLANSGDMFGPVWEETGRIPG